MQPGDEKRGHELDVNTSSLMSHVGVVVPGFVSLMHVDHAYRAAAAVRATVTAIGRNCARADTYSGLCERLEVMPALRARLVARLHIDLLRVSSAACPQGR
jgi:hypothetical protein